MSQVNAVNVEISVVLGRSSLPMQQLLRMGRGAVIPLDAKATDEVWILANNHPQLYESVMVDVSDVAEEIGGKQGGWHDYAKVNCLANGRWIGVPQFIVSWAVTYREDWFKEAGFEYPKTSDEFRKVGRAFKAKGKPFGQAFGHSINDPNAWAYPIVWMWGGHRSRSRSTRRRAVCASAVAWPCWSDQAR